MSRRSRNYERGPSYEPRHRELNDFAAELRQVAAEVERALTERQGQSLPRTRSGEQAAEPPGAAGHIGREAAPTFRRTAASGATG